MHHNAVVGTLLAAAMPAADAPPPAAVLAALITGTAMVLVPVVAHYLNQSAKRNQQPAEPTHQFQPQFTINYNPTHNAAVAVRRRRRGGAILMLAIFAIGLGVIMALWVTNTGANLTQTPTLAPTASTSTSPVQDNSGSSTTTNTATDQESTQRFMATYDTTYSANKSADTIAAFWDFPARWYGVPAVPDATTLFNKYLKGTKPAAGRLSPVLPR